MIFKNFFGQRKIFRQRRKFAEKLHGRSIKYVSERREDDDYIIGREGAILVKGDELIVFSSQKDVFRSYIRDTELSELLSLEGAIISGPDMTQGFEVRTVIAYYTYYLKI